MGKSRSGATETLNGTIVDELAAAGDRSIVVTRADKKNYAERLSRALAQRFANELRTQFVGILPDSTGKGQESRARSAKGFKKLDVNYSTPELGLGLGVSVKTINFPDPGKGGRYTKNYTRVDAELRAEATDYHDRQPYAVMIAVIFLPLDACDDGIVNASSFGQSVQIFRYRGGRSEPSDPSMLFEHVFIGLYDTAAETFGNIGFFDVMTAPPKRGRPRDLLTWQELVTSIVTVYDARNRPSFQWADVDSEPVSDLPAGGDLGDDEAA